MMARGWVMVLFLVNSVAQAESLPRAIDVFVLADQAQQIREVETLTDAGVQVQVHQLDAVDRWEREKSALLPRTEDEATAVAEAKAMATAFTEADQRTLIAGWHALRRADALGIKEVPAIVMNDRAVVYGLFDLAAAVRVWQGRQP